MLHELLVQVLIGKELHQVYFQEDLKGFIENLVDDLSLVGEKMDEDYFSLY